MISWRQISTMSYMTVELANDARNHKGKRQDRFKGHKTHLDNQNRYDGLLQNLPDISHSSPIPGVCGGH